MRKFIIFAAVMISVAIYDIGGKPMPWSRAIGAAVLLAWAFVMDRKKGN